MLRSLPSVLQLTVEQVLALAPDASAVAAAKKLGDPKPWKGVAASERAMWGECQGSAVYQVRVDRASLTGKCTCPSRKFPCKHVLGLLLLSVRQPVATASEPEWVAEWLNKREATAEKKAARPVDAPVDDAAQAKRAEQREARVDKGIEALDLWMRDLIRNGLGGLEAQPRSFWEGQAARLVDAQAGGLAGRVRALGDRVGGSPEWPDRLLDGLGRIALLTHAHRRGDAIDEALRAEIRQRIGWSVARDDVIASGPRAADTWMVVGQALDDDERIKEQRTWLVGAKTGAVALILQFAAGPAPFEEAFAVGTAFEGELAFFPGPLQRRALVAKRTTPTSWSASPPGHARIEGMLDDVAAQAANQPLMESVGVVLRDVTPTLVGAIAHVVDRDGAALAVATTETARLLALSGGAPVDLVAEWDGQWLHLLTVLCGNTAHFPWRRR